MTDSTGTFRSYAILLWAIEESDRVDDLAELSRTIREHYAADRRLAELLRKIEDRAGELRSAILRRQGLNPIEAKASPADHSRSDTAVAANATGRAPAMPPGRADHIDR